MKRPRITSCLGVALALAAGGARAAPPGPAAPPSAVDPRAALREKEDAYAAAPSSALAAEIARAYERLAEAGDGRDLRLAVFYYEEALRTELPGPARDALALRLSALRQRRGPVAPAPTAPPLAPPPGELVQHSPALVVGGGVLVGLGVVSFVASAVMFGMAAQHDCDLCGFWAIPAAGAAAHGAGCLGGGIPMITIGRRMIPPPPTPLVTPLWVAPISGASSRHPAAPVGAALTFTF